MRGDNLCIGGGDVVSPRGERRRMMMSLLMLLLLVDGGEDRPFHDVMGPIDFINNREYLLLSVGDR